jgi:hypothetical protein
MVKIVGEVRDLARKATPMAIQTLERIAADLKAPPAAQVAAAVALLDRAWGRPSQAVDLNMQNKPIEERTDTELMAVVADEENTAFTAIQ